MTPSSPPAPGDAGLRATVRADLAAMAKLKGTPFPSWRSVLDLLSLPGTCAVLLFRVGSWCHHHGLRPVSRLCYFANVVLFGADLAPGARVGPGLAIAHPVFCGWGSGLTMGRDVVISGGVRFGTAAVDDEGRAGEPTIGDRCFFLDAAKVLGAVSIGDDAVVAANALVLHDVPPAAVVVGSPARVIRTRSDPEGSGRSSGAEVVDLGTLTAEVAARQEGLR